MRLLWLTVAMGVTGCMQDGAVRIVVDAPSDLALSPLDERLASITLLIQADGQPLRVETRAAGDRSQPLSLGAVPIDDRVQLSLMGTNPAGRLLAYGRAAGPVDVRGGETVDVLIRLRRPFAYVSGGAQLAAFDPTLDRGQPYVSGVGVASPVSAAATPDGAELAVLSGGQLVLVDTATHQAVGYPTIPLEAGATDVVISPDSQWAIVAHGAGGGVSLVNLPAARAGGGGVSFLPIGATGAVAVAGNTAYALVGVSQNDDCGAASNVQPIDLPSGVAGAAIPLGFAASDLAVDPAGSAIFLAAPCRGGGLGGGVIRVDALKTGAVNDLFDLPRPTSIAVSGGRVWAVGHADSPGAAHLVYASSGLDAAELVTVALGVPDERAHAREVDGAGQTVEARIFADKVRARDLAILPDGARLAVVIRAEYHGAGAMVVDPLFGPLLVIPAIDITTSEIELLDAPTGAPLSRMRTECVIDWEHDAYLDDFECTQAPGQDLSAAAYTPTHVAVLYGDR